MDVEKKLARVAANLNKNLAIAITIKTLLKTWLLKTCLNVWWQFSSFGTDSIVFPITQAAFFFVFVCFVGENSSLKFVYAV